jgi:L,D-peptidoglycan transpeptidase YkuD (ErfK/YbiS/YcfS/YnhG family)
MVDLLPKYVVVVLFQEVNPFCYTALMSDTLFVTETKLTFKGATYPCAVGKNGISHCKKEGDGVTPAGIFPIRQILFRVDRVLVPHIDIPSRAIQPVDVWCEDIGSSHYNQLAQQPEDIPGGLYLKESIFDICLVLGYNDDPIIPGAGSGIYTYC